MNAALDATISPFSISVIAVTKGHASKKLVPDAQGHPIKDPAHRLGISAGRVEHVELAGLDGLRDLLTRLYPNQALVHGVPIGSRPGDGFQLVLAEKYAGAQDTIARTLDCFDY